MEPKRKKPNPTGWVNSCLRKKSLSSEVADKIIGKAEIPLRRYFCTYCGKFHLTSKPLKPRRKT